jgi:Rieske Fe-S protein
MSRARDAICARMNCTIAYTAFHLTLDCRCHGSTYEIDGSAIGGRRLGHSPRSP